MFPVSHWFVGQVVPTLCSCPRSRRNTPETSTTRSTAEGTHQTETPRLRLIHHKKLMDEMGLSDVEWSFEGKAKTRESTSLMIELKLQERTCTNAKLQHAATSTDVIPGT